MQSVHLLKSLYLNTYEHFYEFMNTYIWSLWKWILLLTAEL